MDIFKRVYLENKQAKNHQYPFVFFQYLFCNNSEKVEIEIPKGKINIKSERSKRGANNVKI